MQDCKYASVEVHTGMIVCKYEYLLMLVCKTASMAIYKNATMLVYLNASILAYTMVRC